jgi:peptidoglycan/LPS O-acetylase OafA/YrhL
VETFFVISGFLITGILLNNRSERHSSLVLKQFYARRFLRIFPLFYATLAIAGLLKVSSLAGTWYWHASYLSNVCFYRYGWQGTLSHFWSLAVEEQFYLIWPFLMLMLPARSLLTGIVACIVAAPFYALTMNTFDPGFSGQPNQMTATILMPSCMSALGMGALVAYAVQQKIRVRALTRWLLAAGLAGVVTWYACDRPEWLKPFYRLAEDCVLGWLVYSSAKGFGGAIGWFLECAPINYLGKISYGLYIIHNFAERLTLNAIILLGSPQWLVKLFHLEPGRMLLFIIVTVGLASFSWHFFEKPINNLKRYFPYPTKPIIRRAAP